MRIRTLCRLAVLGSCLGAYGSGVQGAEAARIGPRRGLAARPARYGSRAPGVHKRTPCGLRRLSDHADAGRRCVARGGRVQPAASVRNRPGRLPA